MKTVLDALKSCVGYPVPTDTVETIAVRRGNYDSLHEDVSPSVLESKAFALCEADMMKYLATAPNVSEGDVSISMNDKDILINTANSVYAKYDEPLVGVALQPTVENLSE